MRTLPIRLRDLFRRPDLSLMLVHSADLEQGQVFGHLSRRVLLGSLHFDVHWLRRQLHVLYGARGRPVRLMRQGIAHEGRNLHTSVMYAR